MEFDVKPDEAFTGRPDIINYFGPTIGEIKSIRRRQVLKGTDQLKGYINQMNARGGATWMPDLWVPTVPLLRFFWLGAVNLAHREWYGQIAGNAGGVITYELIKKKDLDPQTVTVPCEEINAKSLEAWKRYRTWKSSPLEVWAAAYTMQAIKAFGVLTGGVAVGIGIVKAADMIAQRPSLYGKVDPSALKTAFSGTMAMLGSAARGMFSSPSWATTLGVAATFADYGDWDLW